MTNPSTHPANAFNNQDAISLQDFNRVIHSACDNKYRSRAKLQLHREVRVLCFHFDTDQFEVGTYCDKIKNVFSQGFGFRVATSILPGTTFAQRDILTALEEAFDGMDSDCLLIIYYIGRGEVRHQLGDAQLWIHGRQQVNEQTPEINFNTVRETAIDHQTAKVRMLLDTCHGAGGSIGQYKEIIGACYAEYRATLGEFTDHLVDELTQAACAKNLLTTAQLWTNLTRRHVTANNMGLSNMPWFIAEFEENRTPISTKPIDLTDWSPAPSLSFVGSSQEIKVLLSVHLGNLGQQTDWDIQARIEQNPLIPSRTRVHNVYRSSPSTAILIVSVTLEMWYCLQNHPEVKFLGFEVHTTYM